MGSETQIVRMEDAPLQIIDGDRGKNYPSRTDQLDEGFCLFLNAGNVTDDGFKFDNTTFITKERDKLLRKGKLERKDIVITTRGTVGNVAYYDNKAPYEHLRINSGMVIIRTDENSLDPRFTYYFLKSRSFKNQVQMLRTGSAQPQLPIRDINRIKIPIPALTEQKRIAHILGTLDDKIELNQQTNKTLEAIARAIFKSWFVDFDPVRAKMAGESYPLPDEIIALFPDVLVESELGMIPKGWEFKPFGELLSFHLGGDWGKAERQGEYRVPVRIIRGTDLPDLHNGGIGEVPLRYIKESSFEKRELKDGDIIMEISGGSKGQPTGRSLYITEKLINRFDIPIIPTSFCRLFRPKDQALSILLNIHLRIIYDDGKTWRYQNQSTGISNFQTTYFLENEMVLLPSNDILSEYNHIVQSFILNMQTYQTIILNELREVFLDLLISEEYLM